MMNRLLLILGGGVALLMCFGCEADRLKPSQALPGSNVRNAPPHMPHGSQYDLFPYGLMEDFKVVRIN